MTVPGDRLPTANGTPFGMLKGIRVLDLTTSIAGPYSTMLLGDFGAEVIKVERPGAGDDTRAWGPPFLEGDSLWYLSVNRNKRSIALDVTSEEGRGVLRSLIGACDVVVNNQVPRVQEKLGTNWESVRAIRPDVIFASLTGFGIEGARRDMVCYDLIAEGYSGVMDLTGEPDHPPQKVGTPAADLLAGQDVAMAVLAALFERQRTGEGRCIDVSLVESMTRFMTLRLISYLGSDELPRRTGGKDSVIAIYQTFETADEPMTLGLGNDAIWRRFWTALGEPERAENPAHATNTDRRAARVELVADIQERLVHRPRAEWLELFAERRIPAGPIYRLDEVSSDPHLQDRGLFYRIEREDGADWPQVNTGIRVDGAANAPRRPPPGLGEDGTDILADLLSMDPDAIEGLRSRGIVG